MCDTGEREPERRVGSSFRRQGATAAAAQSSNQE